VLETSLSESLSSLLAATVAFAIGTSVVLRDRRREQFVLFAVFCFNLGLFHLSHFFYTFSKLHLFGWFAQTISLLLPWSADRCLSSFVPSVGHRGGGKIQTTVGGLLVIAQMVALLFPGLERLPLWELVPIVLGVYVYGGLLYATTRVWRAARAAEGTAAAPRLRYLFYVSVIALGLGSPWVPSIGPIVTAVYLYFVAQTLVRDRLLDLPEVALRIASMSVLIVVVTTLYAILLLWIPVHDASYRSLFVFNAAVASFAVLVLMEPVRTEIESRIEGWVFRDRPVLRRILVQTRQKLLNVIDAEEMAKLVMAELEASGRVTRASLYLLDRRGTSLRLTAHLGGVPPGKLDLATRRPLLERLLHHGTQLRDVLQRERDRARPETQAELDEMLETLGSLKASLALPIVGTTTRDPDDPGGPDLLGALFVDDERLLEPFSREELELFEGLVAQAATTIQNSAVYEARKERDRLAALGEMAAGLAHEIRNPLGAIKGAVMVIEPSKFKLDDTTREFLDVIVEEVDRLNRVVSQFLTYSRPFKGETTPVDPAVVIAGTLRLLSDEQRAKISFDEAVPDVPKVRGDPDALRQVFHNLVLNALDAISTVPDGHIGIEIGVRRRGLLRGDAVAIDVWDNGPGLTAQTMTNLFVPFHTTKSGGTGLGLPISQRIVENHRGVIEVGNPPGGGARFTVLLPAADDLPPPASETSPPTSESAGTPEPTENPPTAAGGGGAG
jgi:two-component system, NtrC family, sensor histidine kinase HydH